MSTYKPGDKVRFIDADAHEKFKDSYPPVGTIGTVIEGEDADDDIYVRWARGTTSLDDKWYCGVDKVEPAEEGTANE